MNIPSYILLKIVIIFDIVGCLLQYSFESKEGRTSSASSSASRRRAKRKRKEERKEAKRAEKARRKEEEERRLLQEEEDKKRRRREAAKARAQHKRSLELARANRPIVMVQDMTLEDLRRLNRE